MPVQHKMNVIKTYKVLEKPAYLKKNKERKVGQKKKIGVLASMRKLLKMCYIPTQAPTQAPMQAPTQAPTQALTQAPTQALTQAPSQGPMQAPMQAPSQAPTQAPMQNQLKSEEENIVDDILTKNVYGRDALKYCF